MDLTDLDQLPQLVNLRELSIDSFGFMDYDDIMPHPHLQRLRIRAMQGHTVTLSGWTALTMLTLEGMLMFETLIVSDMPNLSTLIVSDKLGWEGKHSLTTIRLDGPHYLCVLCVEDCKALTTISGIDTLSASCFFTIIGCDPVLQSKGADILDA